MLNSLLDILGSLLFLLAIPTLYLITLRNTLLLIKVKNRAIEPNNIWFMFIIFFNIFYHFKLVSCIATSLNNEFSDRNMPIDEKRPGETIGYINSIFLALSVITFLLRFNPQNLNLFLFSCAFISWIIYWVKISWYKNLLILDNNYNINNE
jgi:hypothetical protein